MKKLTAEWVRKAEGDLRAAEMLRRSVPPIHEVVCFHCQQAAEKYLKALLQESGLPVPRIHDLKNLYAILLPRFPQLRSLRRGLDFLTDFAVEPRYPGKTATKRQAIAALRWAKRVRAEARKLLAIPQRGHRKKSP